MESHGNVTSAPVTLKPGVSSSYGNGWKQLWPHFLILFLIGIIYAVLSYIISGPQMITQWATRYNETPIILASSIFTVISILYGIFFINPVSYGQSYAYLKAARGDQVEVQDIFAAFKNYWSAVWASLLVSIIVGIGFILIIVPGIIFACKLAFVPYLLVDRKLGVNDAIKESWRMTKGHAGKVFLIGLLGIPIFIAGLICLGVGVIISIMWIQMAVASLYHAVSLEKGAAQPAPGPIIA